MDYFGKDQYRELLDVPRGPAVSIFINADRQNNKGKNNQLAFREQVKRATDFLEQRYPDDSRRDICADMHQWVCDEPFWGSLSGGVAAFFSPDLQRVYRLDNDVDDQAVVGETFHTRPMLRSLLMPRRFWVLVLDRKRTRLFKATRARIAPVDLQDVPTNLDEALQLELTANRTQNRSQGAPRPQGVPSRISGSTPAFHRQSNARDLQPRYLRQFCRAVDRGLGELIHESSAPLILAAPEPLNGLYRQESRLDQLAVQGLQQSLAHHRPAQIHTKAWPMARRAVEAKLDEVLDLWEREYGRGKGEIDLQQIARRTLMSQVRFLLIEQDRHVWGRLDRRDGTVAIAPHDGPRPAEADQVDVLDELAEFVIQLGGDAFVLPADRMPEHTGAAAILRGAGPVNQPSS